MYTKHVLAEMAMQGLLSDRTHNRYTKEELEELAKDSYDIAEVMQKEGDKRDNDKH